MNNVNIERDRERDSDGERERANVSYLNVFYRISNKKMCLKYRYITSLFIQLNYLCTIY